jgi:hypothetical protein
MYKRYTFPVSVIFFFETFTKHKRIFTVKYFKRCVYVSKRYKQVLNPLNTELNPICHLLILLGNLRYMGPCIVSIFQYISNKLQRYTIYLYLETALHVSGGIPPISRTAYNCIYSSWYLSHRYCYLLCAVGSVPHPQHTQTCSNSSTIAADSSNGMTNTKCCRYSCIRSWWWVELLHETYRAVSRHK